MARKGGAAFARRLERGVGPAADKRLCDIGIGGARAVAGVDQLL